MPPLNPLFYLMYLLSLGVSFSGVLSSLGAFDLWEFVCFWKKRHHLIAYLT